MVEQLHSTEFVDIGENKFFFDYRIIVYKKSLFIEDNGLVRFQPNDKNDATILYHGLRMALQYQKKFIENLHLIWDESSYWIETRYNLFKVSLDAEIVNRYYQKDFDLVKQWFQDNNLNSPNNIEIGTFNSMLNELLNKPEFILAIEMHDSLVKSDNKIILEEDFSRIIINGQASYPNEIVSGFLLYLFNDFAEGGDEFVGREEVKYYRRKINQSFPDKSFSKIFTDCDSGPKKEYTNLYKHLFIASKSTIGRYKISPQFAKAFREAKKKK